MPAIAGASLKVLDLIEEGGDLRRRLQDNASHFRAGIKSLDAPWPVPITPSSMIGDAALASQMADRLLERGIYVIFFSFPVVPKGQARIRTQISATHSAADIDQAIAAFGGVGVHRPGSFAEFLSLPQHNVVPIPDGIPDELATIFDPLGNAVHTALSFDQAGFEAMRSGQAAKVVLDW
jgi:hypothetical protein